MATNTAALKTFAQQTRTKLISLITTKVHYVLETDTAELRGYEREIGELRRQIQSKTEKIVIEEVAYTWFNRVMALRFMDANGYNAPMVITPAAGQTRPEILQDAMSGSIDDELMLNAEDSLLPEAKLYKKLLVAVCNKKMSLPMPFLFEHISDYTELLLPDDLLSDHSFVSDIRNGMTDEDCQNVEIIGWLYQFYITDRKADAEAKKSKKVGLKSDEQAAATQLFTPHWIVRYMVENSLGRIWMTLHPNSHVIESMPYYIPTPEGQTDTIPEDIHSAKDIRFLDPCMGSGHILVYAFDLFTKMYEEEGEQAKDIPTLILCNNLFGIDIDRRCYQLASFALTMKARAYYRRYLHHTVNPNVIALEKIDHDIIDSAGTWQQKSLMWQFENIDTIGSLLKLTPEESVAIHVEESSLFGVRQNLLKMQSVYLSKKYHCVVTNPPYLGKGFCDELKNYLQQEFPDSKSDTMASFMERCLDFCTRNGKIAMINMQSWMFLMSYETLRKKLLRNVNIDNLLHLGPHAFDEIGGEVVQCATFVISKKEPNIGDYFRLVDGINSAAKENAFLKRDNSFPKINQIRFLSIPGSPIGYWVSDKVIEAFTESKISELGISDGQNITGDNGKYMRLSWEVDNSKFGKEHKWVPMAKGGEYRKWAGNISDVVNWSNEAREEYRTNPVGRIQREYLWYRIGITWNLVSGTGTGFRFLPDNVLFNKAAPTIVIKKEHESSIYYALGFLNTKVVRSLLNLLNPTMNTNIAEVFDLPIIYENQEHISDVAQQCVRISQLDWDTHETSWNYKINALLPFAQGTSYDLSDSFQMNVSNLNVALECLVTRYKAFWEKQLIQLHKNEEELNREFIEIYGLQDELTPDVSLDEITILQKGEISIENNKIVWHDDVIIKQFISYLVGCLMGRYSVDKPGLIIASQGQKVADLDLPDHTIEIDDDGIIPIIQEEDFFADDMTQRIETAVKKLFGEEHYYDNIKYITKTIGQSIRDYLYKNYYVSHQQLYSVKGAKRPIYWLFSSQMGDKKKKGYFKALIYMHRLEADSLSKLHADYVHPYLQKISHQLIEAEDNATRDDLNQAQHNKAIKLAEDLRDKVREVKAFETTLVEMASARITIDLDDGVKANYPKFYPLVEPIKGLEESED